MATYKTPGVYIEEISKFPPSVAQVETAIPVFIGHTQIAKEKVADDLRMTPHRITSMLEYETYFGFAQDEENIVVTIDEDSLGRRPTLVTAAINGARSRHIMYYALQAYFGEGEYEKEMIDLLIKNGYTGDFGILGHVENADVKTILEANIKGLKNI